MADGNNVGRSVLNNTATNLLNTKRMPRKSDKKHETACFLHFVNNEYSMLYHTTKTDNIN